MNYLNQVSIKSFFHIINGAGDVHFVLFLVSRGCVSCLKGKVKVLESGRMEQLWQNMNRFSGREHMLTLFLSVPFYCKPRCVHHPCTNTSGAAVC